MLDNTNVHCITNDSLPIKDDFILLDTNVIIDITGYANTTNPIVQETKDFLKKLSHNNVIGVISSKTWEEINIIVERDIIGNKHKNPSTNMDLLTSKVDTTINNIQNNLNLFPNIYTEPIGSVGSEIMKNASKNRSKYKLKWGDSVILAIAQENEIQNILTCDKDYLKVDDGSMNIFVDSHTYNNYTNSTNLNIINSSNPNINIAITK